jgi:hypothetical protein
MLKISKNIKFICLHTFHSNLCLVFSNMFRKITKLRNKHLSLHSTFKHILHFTTIIKPSLPTIYSTHVYLWSLRAHEAKKMCLDVKHTFTNGGECKGWNPMTPKCTSTLGVTVVHKF